MQLLRDFLPLIFRIGKLLCELIPVLYKRLFFGITEFLVFDDDRLLGGQTVPILHRLVFNI